MKPGSIRFLALAAVASLPLMAQQPSPSPQPPTGNPPQATSPQQTNPEPGASENSNPNAPPSSHVSSPKLSPVTVELEKMLDTKDAKNGDSVVVKTTETATTPNGMEIPKGSEIKGHIVGVAAKGQEGPNSRVAIQFDQAQLQTGQNLQIRSVIQSVSPAGMTGSKPSGAVANPPAGGNPAATGNPPAASSQAPGANPSGPGPAGDPSAPGTVVATKGNLAIKTTAIPGVLLIGDVYGRPFADAAGALLGANRDVHLDGGTVMVVAIMTAPPAVGTK